jgi:hypothetical protein
LTKPPVEKVKHLAAPVTAPTFYQTDIHESSKPIHAELSSWLPRSLKLSKPKQHRKQPKCTNPNAMLRVCCCHAACASSAMLSRRTCN